MKGRKPKPLAIHKLEGTYRADRHGDAPAPAVTIPDPPEHLDLEAIAEWKRLATEMERLGTLQTTDRVLMATFCQLWSRMVEAERGINEHGLLIKGATGAPQINPFYSVAIRTAKELRSIASELGITPTSRHSVKANKPESAGVMKRQRA